MDYQPEAVTAGVRTQVIQNLQEKVSACYVFPDIAEQICTCLQKHLVDGDYEELEDGSLFALALTLHLQEVNHDEHLWVRWHHMPLPDNEGQLRLNPEWQSERKLEAQLANYGIHKVERLPGNIGCLDIHYFHRPAWGGDTAVAAMKLLENTEALIVDLRSCEGGYPGMVALFYTFLFGEDLIHLDSIYWRDDDFTQQYWTFPYIPGKRFTEKPVYVLISRSTFSAGEAFAYNLQVRQRATVVGERTDGGAHPGASYRLHPHFEAFIPIGRVINPITGTNWEGVGITPDMVTTSEYAFSAAYRLALESALERCGESPLRPNQALCQEARSALEGIPIISMTGSKTKEE